MLETKPADMLRGRVESDFLAKVTSSLTAIRSVNKVDVITMLATFGSLRGIVEASEDDLSLCPGLGPTKVQRLFKASTQSFVKGGGAKSRTAASAARIKAVYGRGQDDGVGTATATSATAETASVVPTPASSSSSSSSAAATAPPASARADEVDEQPKLNTAGLARGDAPRRAASYEDLLLDVGDWDDDGDDDDDA